MTVRTGHRGDRRAVAGRLRSLWRRPRRLRGYPGSRPDTHRRAATVHGSRCRLHGGVLEGRIGRRASRRPACHRPVRGPSGPVRCRARPTAPGRDRRRPGATRLFRDEPLLELFVAEQDHTRTWWRDLEADVVDGNHVYETTLAEPGRDLVRGLRPHSGAGSLGVGHRTGNGHLRYVGGEPSADPRVPEVPAITTPINERRPRLVDVSRSSSRSTRPRS